MASDSNSPPSSPSALSSSFVTHSTATIIGSDIGRSGCDGKYDKGYLPPETPRHIPLPLLHPAFGLFIDEQRDTPPTPRENTFITELSDAVAEATSCMSSSSDVANMRVNVLTHLLRRHYGISLKRDLRKNTAIATTSNNAYIMLESLDGMTLSPDKRPHSVASEAYEDYIQHFSAGPTRISLQPCIHIILSGNR